MHRDMSHTQCTPPTLLEKTTCRVLACNQLYITHTMKIHCISILSRHGTPIYLRNYSCEDDVKYHYLAHTSLDIIDTRLSQPTSYLGHLQTVGDLSVYGYITNTNVKIIVISSATTDTPTVRSSHMRRACECVHAAYVALVCNPFNERREEDKIHSDRFDMVVEKLCQLE